MNENEWRCLTLNGGYVEFVKTLGKLNIIFVVAVYVNERNCSKEYFNRARGIIPIMVDILWKELNADGKLGACARISLQLYKMLQEAGLGCYMMIKGTLNVQFNSKENIDFMAFQK